MNPTQSILTVTQLNKQVKNFLEHEIGEIQVEGEVSNLSRPSSGHFYFTLKDANAQVRCVFFKNRHHLSAPTLKDGLKIVARGRLSLYEARGDYQLIMEGWQEAGLGDLFKQFEALKNKLAAEGLFAEQNKKALPRFPQCIGIVTSPTGAALRDIQTTLARRYPFAKVILYPSEVQGLSAPIQLIKALEKAKQENTCDVIILARGGGSIEDLWAFNDEQLARSIFACPIPIVSGVGHETDFTIADFVADHRAATPTAAAEAVTPNTLELLQLIEQYLFRITQALNKKLQHNQLLLNHQLAKLTSPESIIIAYKQSVDYLERQLLQAYQNRIQQNNYQIFRLLSRLNAQNPKKVLITYQLKFNTIYPKLIQIQKNNVDQYRQKLKTLCATLNAVSPLATLDRGYALATFKDKVIYSSQSVKIGQNIQVRLSKGSLDCQVVDIKGDDHVR